jgi:drug/metabolite transporter (DMT)-like permease
MVSISGKLFCLMVKYLCVNYLKQLNISHDDKGGKSAFITTMYVIIVPVIEWVFPCLQGKMTILAWVAALSSVLGLYLLSGCAEESCIDTNLGVYVCI